ncbi:hypothetical protein P154DRAFT_537810 [Amniculicola lignicola CBS 123094]|uniref:Uncharacterized protein n=1 Tax=Amniculicola lignicola CBS 123094 TaxID=1392246 RepID=A0A6A5W8Y4_9PLEO|nr:hypothetical protein P154DRAFT_537810 [Amniculicola lignicola CBS 123094]
MVTEAYLTAGGGIDTAAMRQKNGDNLRDHCGYHQRAAAAAAFSAPHNFLPSSYIEIRSFNLKSSGQLPATEEDPEMISRAKGNTLQPVGAKEGRKTCGPHWRLTSEHAGALNAGIADLTFEFIINGVSIKLQSTGLADEEGLVLSQQLNEIKSALVIFSSLKRTSLSVEPNTDKTPQQDVQPQVSDHFKIKNIPDIYGDWVLLSPSIFLLDSLVPGVQVTCALPMEAIQALISVCTGVIEGTNVFCPLLRSRKQNGVVVERDDFVIPDLGYSL